jgi:hypothetical protein
MKKKASIWKWVCHPEKAGIRFRDVGILADGTLHNPNGYPDDIVRLVVEAAIARLAAKRKEVAIAKRAAKRKEAAARATVNMFRACR